MKSEIGLRVFAAVALDDALKASVERIEEQLRVACGKETVRWVRPDHLHLTLKFFGNVRSDQIAELSGALGRSCQGIQPFALSLGGLGCFPSIQRPSVVWLGIGGDLGVLETLQKQIDQATNECGSHSETRAFRAHLTIGRVKSAGGEVGQAVQNTSVGEQGRWDVRHVELFQSTLSAQGSAYRQLASVTLG